MIKYLFLPFQKITFLSVQSFRLSKASIYLLIGPGFVNMLQRITFVCPSHNIVSGNFLTLFFPTSAFLCSFSPVLGHLYNMLLCSVIAFMHVCTSSLLKMGLQATDH